MRNEAAGTAPGWGVEKLGYAKTQSVSMMLSHSMGAAQGTLDVPSVLLHIRSNMARRGPGSMLLLSTALRKAGEASPSSARLGRLTRSI